MDWSLLATWYAPAGLIIGLVAAAPIGPVNILVLQKALNSGWKPALLLGLGAALGDVLFAITAALGVSKIKILLLDYEQVLQLFSALLLLIFALILWRTKPHLEENAHTALRIRHYAAATFMMTITNPATLFWFVAIFSAVGFANIGYSTPLALYHSSQLVLGVFLGAMAWWVLISAAALKLGKNIQDHHLTKINRFSAFLLVAFAIYTLTDSSKVL